jgi:hypothetical protein
MEVGQGPNWGCSDKEKKNTATASVLHGCKSWSKAVREEHRLRVIENKVLRGIFGHISEEATRRRLHYWELLNYCSSLNTVMMIKSRRGD